MALATRTVKTSMVEAKNLEAEGAVRSNKPLISHSLEAHDILSGKCCPAVLVWRETICTP